MALTGSTIASTYLKLLRINTDTMGADATASYIQDSADTDSALSISTTRVGIGTAAPSSTLHLVSSTSEKPYIIIENTNADGNAPGLKFNKNSSSPADGDELGQILWFGDDDAGNSTGYANIFATSADVTNGTEDGSLFFNTRVNDSNAPRLAIVDGNVGIGVTNPSDYDGRSSEDLVVGGTSGAHGITIVSGTDSVGQLTFADGDSGDAAYRGRIWFDHNAEGLYFTGGDGTGTDMAIMASGNVGIGVTPSGWDTYGKVLQIGEQFNIMANDDGQDTYITANRYYNGGWKWQNTDTGASQIFMSAGEIKFSNTDEAGASHSAGDAQTIYDRMSIAAAGDVTVSTGNLIMGTSGKGISFAATADAGGMTSELLDDYEEGTWTPIYRALGGSIGSTAGSATGAYTKIGRMIIAQGSVVLTNKGSWTGGVRFAGLPIAAAGSSQGNFSNSGSVTLGNTAYDGSNITPYIIESSTTFYIDVSKISTARTILDAGNVTNTSEFYFTMIYYI